MFIAIELNKPSKLTHVGNFEKIEDASEKCQAILKGYNDDNKDFAATHVQSEAQHYEIIHSQDTKNEFHIYEITQSHIKAVAFMVHRQVNVITRFSFDTIEAAEKLVDNLQRHNRGYQSIIVKPWEDVYVRPVSNSPKQTVEIRTEVSGDSQSA